MSSKFSPPPLRGKSRKKGKPGFTPDFCQEKNHLKSAVDGEEMPQNPLEAVSGEGKTTQFAGLDLRSIPRGVGRPLKPSIEPTAASTWLVRATVAGRPKKKTCRTKEEAEALVQSWSGAAPLPLLPTRLPIETLRKAEAVDLIATSFGVDLLFVGTWFSQHYKPADGAITWADAWKEYEDRKGENSSKARLINVQASFDSFAKFCGTKTIGSPSRETVEKWLDKVLPEGCKPATYNHRINDLSTVLAWLTKRGQMAKNPCQAVDRRKIVRKIPFLIAPDVCEASLRYIEKNAVEWVPWYALMLFGGVRPGMRDAGECRRLSDDIEAGEKIYMPGGILIHGKGDRDRILPWRASGPLKDWLDAYPLKPLPKSARAERNWSKLRAQIGFTIEHQDVLRHVAASCMAHSGKMSLAEVALAVGNSDRMLLNHYIGLWGREMTEHVYGLMPLNGAAKVVSNVA